MAEQWFRHKWLDAIYASELDPTTRHVAEIFAGKARQDSIAWEPLSNLVMKTGRTKKTCIKARQTLVDGGWLTEVKASTHKAAPHFLLVIPGTEGCSHYTPEADEGVEPVHPRGVATTPQRGTEYTPRGVATTPSQSVVNPDQSISLSPEQSLVKDLLGLDERDERLMKIPSILQDNNVRHAKVWLRSCHENGDLLDLLEKTGATSSGWGAEPDDDGTMPNPGYVDGWGTPERIKVEDYYKPRVLALGYSEQEADAYLHRATEIFPDGSERKCWHEAYMTALNDAACEDCGRQDGKHSLICQHNDAMKETA